MRDTARASSAGSSSSAAPTSGRGRRRHRLALALTTTFALLLWAALALPAAASAAPGTITEYFEHLQEEGVKSMPVAIAAGPEGNVFFADNGGAAIIGPGGAGMIGKITPAGTITESASLPTIEGRVSEPTSLAAACGSIWATVPNNHRIVRVNPATLAVTEITAGLNAGAEPYGLTVGPEGNLWFTDNGPTRAIGKVDLTNCAAPAIAEYTSGLSANATMASITSFEGKLWFADNSTVTPKAVGKITPGTPPTIEEIEAPAGTAPIAIAAGPGGKIWFTNFEKNFLYSMTTAGAFAECEVPGSYFYAQPEGITTGPDGNLWFTDAGSFSGGILGGKSAIGKIVPGFALSVSRAGAGAGTVSGGSVAEPSTIACGATCEHEYGNGEAVTLTASPAAGSTFGGWSGACSGSGACEVTMGEAKSVTATFSLTPPPVETCATNPALCPPPPPPPPPPPTAGTATVASAAKVKAGKAALKLSCSGGPCKGALKLTAKLKVGAKTKNMVIGKASFSLASGAKATLKVKLSAAAKSALAKAKALKAKVSGTGVLSSTVKLKLSGK